MANIDDSTTGKPEVNEASRVGLTPMSVHGAVTDANGEVDKVSLFLRRVMPVVSNDATHPMHALVPWACDVLQSKKSVEVYGQDIRDFVVHMQRVGVEPTAVTADHVKLYKAALRDAGLSAATIARKMSVLRGVYRQFAAKGLVRWEVA